jgi:DNA polymerase elongation subunit (family B)
MYQNIYYDNKTQTVHIWDDKTGYFTLPYKKYAYIKDRAGTNISLYGDKLKKVYRFDPETPNLWESDVPPETRMLVDNYADSEELSTGHRIMTIDIEVEVTDGFPYPEDSKDKITAIAVHNSEEDEYYCLVLDEKRKLTLESKDNVTIESFETEFDLLNRFFLKYLDWKPTIITGWNSDSFDMPYIYNRACKIVGSDIANLLSPIRETKWNKHRKRFMFAGVSCLDYLALYKLFTYTQLSSYRLDAVAEHELSEKKVEYSGTLNDLYENNIDKFVEYNIHDVRLVKRLHDKLDFIDMARGVCHVGHVPYEDVYFSSRYLEGAILVYLKNLGIVAPNKPPRPKMNNDDKFVGAYVQSPQRGKHDWVFDLDITSMYPSVIMSLNVSPETKMGKLKGWNVEEFMKGTKKTYTLMQDDKEMGKLTETELKDFFENNKVSVSSNGVLYRSDKKGLIPALLEKWFDTRVEYRKLMKKFGDEGDNEKYTYFKSRQLIQKVVLNSLYGVLGLPVFRFYDLDNAEATTLTGQELIKFTKKIGNHFYNKELGDDKDYCIYIDTDSVFYSALPLVKKRFPTMDFDSETLMSKRILDVADEIQKFMNGSYDYFAKKFLNLDKHRFEIKQELIAKSGLFIVKKRYGMKIINDNGVKVNKLHVKGLDLVRSNFPKAMGELLKSVLEDILATVPKEKIDERIINFKESMKLLDFDRIAMPTGINNLKKYTNGKKGKFTKFAKGAPAHIKAALTYNDLLRHFGVGKKYEKISNSEKIKWVYLKQNDLGLLSCGYKGYEDPPQVIDFIKKNIDYKKMYAQMLEKKIMMFYESLKWNEPVNKKTSMERFF